MADLVIKGLGIPKERSLWLCIKTDGTVYNIKPGGIGTAHAVETAVPLPEGHGRLIDADTLMNNIGDVPYKGSVKRVLMSAPTIIPAEGGGEYG